MLQAVSGKKFSLIVALSALLSVILGLCAHYLLRPKEPPQYSTLTEISRYAHTLREFPEPDDHDWLDPLYKTFNKTRLPSPFERVLRNFGIIHLESWSPRHLSQLLKELTKKNHGAGLFNGKESFIHIKSIDKTVIYVFGDLHGAFHSLVRDLEHLHERGVLDDNLRILDENTYIVFNGDAINRSPYSIDTLTLIATTLRANPKNAIYVAGNHERDSHWVDYGLRRELIDRASHLSTRQVPYQTVVDDFFATLPEAVYVSFAQSGAEIIRIAFNDKEHLSFDEEHLSPNFLEQKERITANTFKEKKPNERPIDTRAAIKTEEWRLSNRTGKGLGLLDQDQGATTWAVLSSPIAVHRLYLDFNYDAFARLDLNHDVNAATITRIYSDTRTQNGFQEDPSMNMISAKTGQTSNHNIIKVASTMSLIRGVPTMGRSVQRGLDLSINMFNHREDNLRHLIRLYIDNDDYIPANARNNVITYVKDRIPFLLVPTGTPTTMAYMDLVKKEDLIVLFPITGSGGLRSPDFKKLIHFRASYEDEVRALINELRTQHGSLKFAFLYQDDSYGRGPFQTAVSQLHADHINDILPLPYTRATTSFENQINEFKKAPPDALGFFATAAATQEFIRQLGASMLANTKLFAISFAAESTLRRYAKNHGLNFLFGAVVPNPKTTQAPIARRYRKAMDHANLSYDVFSFEAFLATSIFINAIEQLGNKPITSSNILRQLESIKSQNFEGISINFNTNTRSLSKHVWLETGENTEWKAYVIR